MSGQVIEEAIVIIIRSCLSFFVWLLFDPLLNRGGVVWCTTKQLMSVISQRLCTG